jgi:flavin-dependent dehydrogenase
VTDHPIIRIAGAGPSGLAAAIALARAGRAVQVHEAKGDVGARFIGDLQVIENASEPEDVRDFLSRIGVETNFYFRPARRATFFDAHGHSRIISSSAPYAYFIRRGPFEGTLDRGLLAQARDAGAEVLFNSRLDPKNADIVATGPASPDGLAKEITFESDFDGEIIDVYFDHRTAPGGYSYLFVLDGLATFGCAVVSDFKNIDDYFDHSLAAARKIRGIDTSRGLRTGYSYMNFHLKRTAEENGARYVGEAAGFQDYLFGLGIRYALTTGNLAARSILEERSFDELWHEAIAPKQATSLVNRFLYEAGGNAGLSIFVRQASRAKDFHRYLASWHRTTLWKRMLAPLIRRMWRHQGRCLHKPGEHWCRSRDTQVRVPPLGPLKENAQS